MALTLAPADYQMIATRVGYSPTEVILADDPGYQLIAANEDNVIASMEELYKWRGGTGTGSDAWPALFKEAVLDKLAGILALSLMHRPETADFLEKRSMEALGLIRGQDDFAEIDVLEDSLGRAELEAWPYHFATKDLTCSVIPIDPPVPGYNGQINICVDIIQLLNVLQEKRELRYDRVGNIIKLYDYRSDGGDVYLRGVYPLPQAEWPELLNQAVAMRVLAHKALVWERALDRAKELENKANSYIKELRAIDRLQSGRDIEDVGRAQQEIYPWHWNHKTMLMPVSATDVDSQQFAVQVVVTRDMLRIHSVRRDGRDLRYERTGKCLLLHDDVPVGEAVEVIGQWYVPQTEWPEMFRQGVEMLAQAQRELATGGAANKIQLLQAAGQDLLQQAKAADSQQHTVTRIPGKRFAAARYNAPTIERPSR